MRTNPLYPIFISVFFMLVFGLFWGCWYTVGEGNRAIVLRFGKMVAVTDPGLHIKMPYTDSVHEFSVRTQKVEQAIDVYSKDIQGAVVKLSINFSLNPASVADVYSQFGTEYVSRIITPQLVSKPKDVFGKFNAVEIVQTREKMASEILSELNKQFEGTGVTVESVQIENIDFSDEYERNVEERMRAEVEVQKVKQNLEREKINADMMRTQAQGRADAKIAEARAESESIRIVGLAEAEAIEAKSRALSKEPNYIRYMEAQKWNGELPSSMIPAGSVPILNIR